MKACVENHINIFKEKIIVLKIKKKTQVQHQSRNKPNPADLPVIKKLNKIADQIISQYTGHDNTQIINIKISIKPQGHTCQK